MKNKFFYLLMVILSLFCLPIILSGYAFAKVLPSNVAQTKTKLTFLKSPLSFEANKGQSNNAVKYLSRNKSHTLFLTKNEAVLSLLSDSKKQISVKIKLLGANKNPKISGLKKLPGEINYFIGNDPKKWLTNIPTYGKVKYSDIYPGIDLVYYGNQEKLEYDLVVAPGVNPKTITLKFKGAKKLELDKEGNLVLHTNGEKIVQKKPIVYQETSGSKKEIVGNYILKANNEIGFKIDKYDTKRTLVIDPQLVYSTYLGGTGNGSDAGNSIAVDSQGNAYVTGQAQSTDFPTTSGAFQTVNPGTFRDSAFVSKFSPTGTLIYSTFLGGTQSIGDEKGKGIAVDESGNAYVLGETRENDFPITSGAIQAQVKNQNIEAFITKLNSTGSSLIYSTFLGSPLNDTANGIAIDTSGNAYIIGRTDSPEFPTTQGAFQITSPVANAAVFISKINPTGTVLIYSTFLGGSQYEEGYGIAVDGTGNAYVAGNTSSSNFPITQGVIQSTLKGVNDVFVTKLNPNGTGLVYSTFLGGSSSENAFDSFGIGGFLRQYYDIAVDQSGNAFVTGATQSNDFPTTNGTLQSTKKGTVDSFVAKLNPSGTSLLYSTYLGGTQNDAGTGIAVDSNGNAYVVGTTVSSDFLTQNAVQANQGNDNVPATFERDAFVTVLNPGGSAALFSTYFGGGGADDGYALAIDTSKNIFITGGTYNTNLPLINPYQNTLKGYQDGFVAKISAAVEPIASPTPSGSQPTLDPKKNIIKALKDLNLARKKLARASKPARPISKKILSLIKQVQGLLGAGEIECEENLTLIIDDLVSTLQEVFDNICASNTRLANPNVKYITKIKNCIDPAAAENFRKVVDVSTDAILDASEVDDNEDFVPDVCQQEE